MDVDDVPDLLFVETDPFRRRPQFLQLQDPQYMEPLAPFIWQQVLHIPAVFVLPRQAAVAFGLSVHAAAPSPTETSSNDHAKKRFIDPSSGHRSGYAAG